ncbi:hypothetical protein [Amycolatopsis magusensis]|uniref:hypothetical protein n=1 Tax=Amycolatopsis magusensis TaxID=882444 RepID=UPI0037A8AC95
MTEPATPQPSEPTPEWGAPAPRPRWSGKKTAAAAAIAVGIAATGGVAVYAASGTSVTEQGGGPGGMMNGGPIMRSADGLGAALHGEYTVSDGKGGFTTEVMQAGEVTEISATSATVKSQDGYTKTYAIDGSTTFGRQGTAADIAGGDTVTVTAVPNGDAATAKTITERTTQLQGGPQQGGPQGQQPPGN